MPQLAALKRLVVLDCRGCKFEGALPTDMPPHLQRLLLADNRLDGPVHKWACPKMRVLNLSHNKLSGVSLGGGVGCFADMPELETLDCQGNRIEAPYAQMFGDRLPQSLTYLNCARNQFHGPIGSATSGAASLEYLSLAHNHLTGPCSENFGLLSRLRDLRLGHNHLTGPLPLELTSMRSLRCLSLRGNDLVGPLDAVRWGGLNECLEHLDLGNNPRLGGRLEAVPPSDPLDPVHGARRRKRACCRSGALGPLRRSGAPTMVTPHGFGTLCGAAWSSTSQPTFRDASA